MSAALKLPTIEDLLRAEDAAIPAEIVNGELVQKAMGTARHGNAQMAVGVAVRPRRSSGPPQAGWWILTEATVGLSATEVYRPDLSGWRRERMPELPRTFPITVAPDWVCEVLSESTAGRDLGPKQRAWHAHRVPHYWLVDPERMIFTVLRWSDAGYVVVLTAGPGERVRAEPFGGVEIETDDLFGVP